MHCTCILFCLSALAPTSSKLTTQYMVMDHMKNHYSKITNAKREYSCTTEVYLFWINLIIFQKYHSCFEIYFLRCYREDLFLCVVLSSLRFFYFILYLSAAIDNRAPKSISSSQKGKYLSRNELNNHTDKNWQLLCRYIVMNITSIKLNKNLLPK